ncbi:MAG: DUF4124 domain-containing protein [Gammaproteobacteria bacterium]|nr:DUF4124 domain-containing protein [Gammaproteobacteria bacterium]
MKILSASLLAVLIGGGLASGSALAAKLYKWTDADGNVSYQDQPPPDNVESEVIANQVSGGASTPANSGSRSPVVIYTVANCSSCAALLAKMRELKVPAEERSLQDREVQARILALTDSLKAPTMFIGEEMVQTLTDSNIIKLLGAAGYDVGQTAAAPNASDSADDAE